jgi:hypothetical protein
MESGVLKGLRSDIDRLEADFQKTYQKLKANEIAKLHDKKILTGQEFQFFVTRLQGLKLDQLKLYVDTLYAKALYKEKKYEEAAKVAGEWRKRTDWKLEPRGIDQAEKYSYASEQTLRNMLAGFDFAARLETVDKDPAKKLDLITEFLDHRDALAAADDLGVRPGVPKDRDRVGQVSKCSWGLEERRQSDALRVGRAFTRPQARSGRLADSQPQRGG